MYELNNYLTALTQSLFEDAPLDFNINEVIPVSLNNNLEAIIVSKLKTSFSSDNNLISLTELLGRNVLKDFAQKNNYKLNPAIHKVWILRRTLNNTEINRSFFSRPTYQYHFTTKFISQNNTTHLYRSDFYLAIKKNGFEIKNTPFTMCIHAVKNKFELDLAYKQALYITKVSKSVHGKVPFESTKITSFENENFSGDFNERYSKHAQSKKPVISQRHNAVCTLIPVVGTELYEMFFLDDDMFFSEDNISKLTLVKKLEIVILILEKLKEFHDEERFHGNINLKNIAYNVKQENNNINIIDNTQTYEIHLINFTTIGTKKNQYFATATPGFIAPESYLNIPTYGGPVNTTFSSDIYSVGGVIGCIFFGLPFAHLSNDYPDEGLPALDRENVRKNFLPYDFKYAKEILADKPTVVLTGIYNYLFSTMCDQNFNNRSSLRVRDCLGFFKKMYRVAAGHSMAYPQGIKLHDMLIEKKLDKYPLSFRAVLVSQLLDQLKIFHDKNLFHGNINLSNIIYDKEEKSVCLMSSQLSTTSYPSFMEFAGPEVYKTYFFQKGKSNLKSDIYAIGGIIGCMFFGLKFAHLQDNNKKLISTEIKKFYRYNFKHAHEFISLKKGRKNLVPLYNYLLLVTHENPSKRPNVDHLLNFFSDLLFAFTEEMVNNAPRYDYYDNVVCSNDSVQNNASNNNMIQNANNFSASSDQYLSDDWPGFNQSWLSD